MTMAVILTAAVLIVALGVLALLVLVLVGIRTEERHMTLTSAPRTRTGALSRRLTGASTRRPGNAPRCRYQDVRR